MITEGEAAILLETTQRTIGDPFESLFLNFLLPRMDRHWSWVQKTSEPKSKRFASEMAFRKRQIWIYAMSIKSMLSKNYKLVKLLYILYIWLFDRLNLQQYKFCKQKYNFLNLIFTSSRALLKCFWQKYASK